MTRKVCYECNRWASHVMQTQCCKSERPLCENHATAMRNTLKLLAQVHTEAVRCDNCEAITSKQPTVKGA